MAKITLDTITSGFQSTSQVNNNNADIATNLNDKVLYRDNPTGEPNQMDNLLDMNSNKIINLPAPGSPTEPFRFIDLPASIIITTEASVIFDTVSDMVVSTVLSIGDSARTLGYNLAGDGGEASYLIAATQAVDGQGDIGLASGNVALLQIVAGVLPIEQYGSIGDDLTLNTAAVSAWGARLVADNLRGTGSGIHRFGAGIVLSSPCVIMGVANGVDNIGETDGFILKKFGNFIGIEVTNSSGVTLTDFTVDSTTGQGDTSQGIKLTMGGRSKLHRMTVTNQGSHGIEFNNGNLSSFRDIYVLGNTGKGLFVNGTATPNTNTCVFSNIDARGNTGDGVDLANAWNVFGNFVCQSNGGRGLVADNVRGSKFVVYGESNTGSDIEFTNNTNFEGNDITIAFFNTFTNSMIKPEQNNIQLLKEGADTRAIYEYINAKRLRIPTGIGISGSMSTEHPSSAKFFQFFEETGQDQTIEFKNVGTLSDKINDAPVFAAYLQMNGAIFSERLSFTNADTSPDVSLSQYWLANNSGATTITTFNGGISGMEFTLLADNANTTLQHTAFASATGIVLKSGGNEVLSTGETKRFIRNGSNWWLEV